MLSGDGERIAVSSNVSDAGGGISETSICPAFEGGPCEIFGLGGMGGEGWDPARASRTADHLRQRLAEGRFKPMVEAPLHSIVEAEADFAPIRVERRQVRVRSGDWTIEVRGERRFALSLRGPGRVARGVVSCTRGPGIVTGAVTGAVVARDGERLALWVELVCSDESSSGVSWERVALRVSPASSGSRSPAP
jgi:hypothetical protein